MKPLSLKTILKESWRQIAGFKAAFWQASVFPLFAFCAVGISTILILLMIKLSIIWLAVSGLWFLLGCIFVFIPVQVGVFRLSVLYYQKKPFKATDCFRYLNKGLVLKLGVTGFIAVFASILLIPGIGWWTQVVAFVLSLWLNAAAMLIWLYIAMHDPDLEDAFIFTFRALKKYWWQLALMMLIGNVIFFIGLITLGIGFIWAAPWFNHQWAQLYLEITAQLQEEPVITSIKPIRQN